MIQVLKALESQSQRTFEVIVVEAGDIGKTAAITDKFKDTLSMKLYKQELKGLVNARNQAFRNASGRILAFIDDDVCPTLNWLKEITYAFNGGGKIGGVGGPSFIPKDLASNRDLTNWLLLQDTAVRRMIGMLYFRIFLDNDPFAINRFYTSGAFSIGSMIKTVVDSCKSIQRVDYLDASNMCFPKDIFAATNGFDPDFKGLGDYSEADLCLRIRRIGRKLLFNPNAAVYHHPSKAGIFSKRSQARLRSRNFVLFYRRHFCVGFKFFSYLFFLWSYYIYKTLSTKDKDWLAGIIGTFGK